MTIIAMFRAIWTMGRGVVKGLPEASGDRDPLEIFEEWFEAAKSSGILLPESMSLATATREGRPSVRMVLLKGFGKDGFDFYTNYKSRKAAELNDNPWASLVFHWAVLQRQVRIEGEVTRISIEESEEYFKSRSRNSQIGAWASAQSSPLENRDALLERFAMYTESFSDGEVPLPPFWGGYRIAARKIEFWQGRADRLHDRLLFIRDGDGWSNQRMFP